MKKLLPIALSAFLMLSGCSSKQVIREKEKPITVHEVQGIYENGPIQKKRSSIISEREKFNTFIDDTFARIEQHDKKLKKCIKKRTKRERFGKDSLSAEGNDETKEFGDLKYY